VFCDLNYFFLCILSFLPCVQKCQHHCHLVGKKKLQYINIVTYRNTDEKGSDRVIIFFVYFITTNTDPFKLNPD